MRWPARSTAPLADFATLGEALDYAATGPRGLNFHDARGTLAAPILIPSCARTRSPTPGASSRSGIKPGDRIAWSPRPAPNSPPASSARSMPALWPVPLPLPTSFGGREPMSTS
jgi:fatty-acyl-CoA synthase